MMLLRWQEQDPLQDSVLFRIMRIKISEAAEEVFVTVKCDLEERN